MPLKFAANLNFIFTENTPTLLEKLQLARSVGFRAVEISFPAKDVIDDIVKVREEIGIEIALMNIDLGSGESAFGSYSIPGREAEFESHLENTISLANALKCKKIHILSGKQTTKSYQEHFESYTGNLKKAAKLLESNNILGVIEPICKYGLPDYFMNSYDTAISVLNEVNSPNLKLLFDIFHLQHIRGNISNTFNEHQSLLGHVQIAQVPHRHEPDIQGELDYSYVFRVIEESKYADWIGCEYKPKTNTIDGLGWITKYGYSL